MNETAARHPNRFLADLTQAMRSTAETARQTAIEQCEADANSYTEGLQARVDNEGDSLRNAAEADVSAIRDWSKAEMERIRLDTEQQIARRREVLEQDLHAHNSAIELEIDTVRKSVADFERDLAVFFERLLKESDPTVVATMAAEMPDPPCFGDGEGGELALIVSSGQEKALEAPEPALSVEAGLPEVEAAAAADAEAAAAAEAEAEAARTAASQAEAEAARTAASQAEAVARPATAESTQVVVVGLVSVASIATFKRQLGRLPGVKNVGVSSGPDGEFIFTVGHPSDVSLGDLIPTLPAFQARVVSEREGVLNVSAHDPETEG